MHPLTVGGVPVDFPYEPYDVQRTYMERVVEALRSKTNALLESPTGTGKTLCLLASTLAWRQQWAAAAESMRLRSYCADEIQRGASAQPGAEDWSQPPPRIIYTSRTHAQLSQVVQELKRLSIKPRMCILGSRDQMCIKYEVASLETTAQKTQACRQKVAQRSCEFHQHVDNFFNAQPDFKEKVADIEEIVQLGRQYQACPYYISRDMLAQAEVIFAPYNYIIDPVTRKAQNLNLTNSIIIVDEAHNLESSCTEAVSFELTTTDLLIALDELRSLNRAMEGGTFFDSEITFSPDQVLSLVRNIDNLCSYISNFAFNPNRSRTGELGKESSLPGDVKPGSFLLTFLAKLNIEPANVEEYSNFMGQCITLLSSSQLAGTIVRKTPALEMVKSFVDGIFGAYPTVNAEVFDGNYRVYIAPVEESVARSTVRATKIHIWCFNSGVAIRELLKSDNKIRSLILTSGTLAPLAPLEIELGTPFKVQLQNGHVIKPHQVWVGVSPVGPSDIKLNSSFRTRNSLDYQVELGNTIINFLRVIPDGVLVFFPSYTVMDDCIRVWRESKSTLEKSIWERIRAIKEPMVEPKRKTDFVSVLSSYYSHFDGENVSSSGGGAVLFAVCRGKISEGIDFADARARAVIITGLPFPPFADPKVVLKRGFLDHIAAQAGKQAATLSSDDWYRQQAARAVNQAIGRVIRHRHDFGAVILCDERFANKSNREMLPMWVNPHLRVHGKFAPALSSIRQFFNEIDKDPSLKVRQGKRRPHISLEFDGSIDIGGLSSGPATLAPAVVSMSVKPTITAQPLPDYLGTTAKPLPVASSSEIAKTVVRRQIGLFDQQQQQQQQEPRSKTPEPPTSKTKSKEFLEKAKALLATPELCKQLFGVMMGTKAGGSIVDVLSFLWTNIAEHSRVSILQDFSVFVTPQTLDLYDAFCREHEFHNPLKGKAARSILSTAADVEPILKKPRGAQGAIEPTTVTATCRPTEVKPPASEILGAPTSALFTPPTGSTSGGSSSSAAATLCMVCRDRVKAPFAAPCKHVACNECWNNVLARSPECPTCGTKTRLKQLRRMYFY